MKKGEFNIIHTEFINEYSIYCRECGSEVDEESFKKIQKSCIKEIKCPELSNIFKNY
jgi:hypothetical protein